MHAASEQPLDLPLATLAAIEQARDAVRRTRHTVELSLAPALAGAAAGVVGMGGSMVCSGASLPAWVKWPLVGSAALLALGGLVLIYWSVWTWIRRGRLGGAQSPFGDASSQITARRRLKYFAMILAFQFGLGIAVQASRGHIPDALFFGYMIWGTRLAVLMGIALSVYRFARSGFWEYLAFAAGISGTLGLYIFVNPGRLGSVAPLPASIAAMSMLATLVAAFSLVGRWRRWTRANRATQAASANDGPTATEMA